MAVLHLIDDPCPSEARIKRLAVALERAHRRAVSRGWLVAWYEALDANGVMPEEMMADGRKLFNESLALRKRLQRELWETVTVYGRCVGVGEAFGETPEEYTRRTMGQWHPDGEAKK